MTKEKTRKSDKNLFNTSSADYIPIACHYDDSTLLTKNGELIQTLQINGINSEQISDNLMNLRDMVRRAISENIKSDKFAFWIHTVRKKTNLDDNTPYSKFFSSNLHEIWRQKNYWHDKFVNTLYITVVYTGADLSVSGFKAFLSSLTFSLTKTFHENYLEQAQNLLSNSVDRIIENLKEFGAKKLSLIYDKEGCFSELLFLYGRIINLYESKIHLPCQDLSEVLASHKYAVGGDKIEVIDFESKKFAAILSLKEYQEISTEELDKFLQLPIEMIVSEAFYFIPKKEALEHTKYQNYILNVSQDEDLKNWKGLTEIEESEGINSFCKQQLSITIIGDEVTQLEQDSNKVAKALSNLGIMNVREDISLEQAFWAQLPGNFQYLKRLTPALTSKVASLASLHNSPAGISEGKWGKFVTILRTERGTPYFVNFHTNAVSSGHTGIFGVSKSGKTVLMNFLLSESTKLNPTILYLTNDNSSEIYIKALEGSWNEAKLGAGFLNPFICKNSETENKYIKDIFKILLSKEDTKPEQKIVDLIADFILKQPPEQRNLQYLQDNFDFETLKAEYYKELLARIIKEDSIANLVNMQQDIALELNSVVAFNLKEITEMDYESKNFPSDPKLRSAYIDKIEALNKVRSIILLSLIHKFINLDPITPKILVIDNFFHLLDTIDSNLMNELLEALNSANGIILTAVNTADHDKLLKLASWKVFYDKLATKMILSSEVVLDDLDKLLELSRLELKKLKTLKPLKRLFMIKQMNNTIVTELSLGGLPGVLKLLSAKESEVKAAFSIIEQKGPAAGDWLEEVYENFTKQE